MSGPRAMMQDMIERPENWAADQYVITNHRLGVIIWIGGGFLFYDWYAGSRAFGRWSLLDQFMMWRALKKWGARKAQIELGAKISCPLCRDTQSIRAGRPR